MAEADNFKSIRISLASPELIRSWSYGEVTKPETINYRTLKPEKDGLFCERIFGPVKDFECYCGKYKRQRYKGVICDKCGVEITRSTVRRQRMGHISLAAPVSHVWYAKSTPSRLGLLLDLSPRSLERVLYFAQYVITSVDEDAKKDLLGQKTLEYEQELERLSQNSAASLRAVNERKNEILASSEVVSATGDQQTQDESNFEHKEILKAAKAAEDKLNKNLGKTTKTNIKFDGQIIASKGEEVLEQHLIQLQEMINKKGDELGIHFSEVGKEPETTPLSPELEASLVEAKEAGDLIKSRVQEIYARLRQEKNATIEEIENIQMNNILSEVRYSDLKEKYGDIFSAAMGAEAILEILKKMNLAEERQKLLRETHSSSGQRRKKAAKRLRIIEALRRSNNRPEWMVLTILPVLPPDLRPMVQLDGGRFATSDLNDLYRRVINRNNRLRRLIELKAPDIIIRNEKRMLQEAVDSLIGDGKRGRGTTMGAGSQKLKSLSDMLRGKQGRFRQNLLGKRVDYSGRSVIVVGPELKLYQCGLPRRMALELFKPFIMHRLVLQGAAHNIKSARRLVEKAKPEVWDILEEVIKERPVLLNRAPTLHRLSIQAFEPVLIDGSAIQIHPMVCTGFNADFDGDQMAVHVPLSKAAVNEAREAMLSVNNMLLPSSGEPVVAPTLDIVLGCHYLTTMKSRERGKVKNYSSFSEAKLAYEGGFLDLQTPVKVRDSENSGKILDTSVGRIIFNEILPKELRFSKESSCDMDKGALKKLVSKCYKIMGKDVTATMLDDLKSLGFHYATKSGITIGINEIEAPKDKPKILDEAEEEIEVINSQFNHGLMEEDERYTKTIKVWEKAKDKIQVAVEEALPKYGGIYLMAKAGAKGNIGQITQMAGMRGLMSDPSGKIIELPIKRSFREGLTVLEYFISTHGARKGLADTALRTSDSGYLTRRLIDVAQDVRIMQKDCGTTGGIWLYKELEESRLVSFAETLVGRLTAKDITDPQNGRVILKTNREIDEEKSQKIVQAGIDKVYVRSIMRCQARYGVCQRCHGWDLSQQKLVAMGTAVGIIAAQSIGEPGTQLTMRTFHTGGVVGIDITSGLPRVEELFEARVPKGQAIISEIDGTVEIISSEEGRKIRVTNTEFFRDEYTLPAGHHWTVENGEELLPGTTLAADSRTKEKKSSKTELITGFDQQSPVARVKGIAEIENDKLSITYEEQDEREYPVPVAAHSKLENGASVLAGEQLTEGHINPQDILRIQGREKVQEYLVSEVQKVYRSQGVNINSKHIETIVRQMLSKVRIETSGDTDLLPGELKERFEYEDINAKVLAQGGEPATAQAVLLGLTRASLNTDSWLAAASFQETTRVLAEAAVFGKKDKLRGLKENVIIGKLIPAQYALAQQIPPALPGETEEIIEPVEPLAASV